MIIIRSRYTEQLTIKPIFEYLFNFDPKEWNQPSVYNPVHLWLRATRAYNFQHRHPLLSEDQIYERI